MCVRVCVWGVCVCVCDKHSYICMYIVCACTRCVQRVFVYVINVRYAMNV